jgi:hypothetical protein
VRSSACSKVRCAARSAPLGELDVGEGQRDAHRIGEVAAVLEPHDGVGVARLRGGELALAPVGEAEQRRRRSPLEGVGFPGQVEGPGGVGDRCFRVAGEQGQPRPVDRDHGRELAVRLVVDDDLPFVTVEPHLGEVEQCFDTGRVAGGHARSGEGVGEHGTIVEHHGREGLEPCSELAFLTGPLHVGRGLLDQLRGADGVTAREGLVDGLVGLAVAGVPVACPAAQVGDALRLVVEQAGAQHVAEQVVVAVPGAAVVERDQEQVRPLQLFEDRLGIVAPGDGRAQRPGQPGQDRGGEEEVAGLRRLVIEDLVGEVVEDEPIIAGELGDERGRIRTSLHRQGGELEGGDPSFGPGIEHVHVVGTEAQVHGAGQVGAGLVGGEPEVRSAHLEEVAVRSEGGEWQRRIGSGRDHQTDLRRQVREQERH